MSATMPYLALAVSLLALVVGLHSVVHAAAAGWYLETARQWRTAPDEARVRTNAKPWFVRYSERLP